MQTSGFANAPVSRLLVAAVVLAALLASVTDTKHLFPVAVAPHLAPRRQLWRLLAWQACYANATEVLFAALTLYQLRVVERLWGSRKFVVCGRGPGFPCPWWRVELLWSPPPCCTLRAWRRTPSTG